MSIYIAHQDYINPETQNVIIPEGCLFTERTKAVMEAKFGCDVFHKDDRFEDDSNLKSN